MPEFQLNRGTLTYSEFMRDFEAFERGYIEAMFFTNGDTGDDNENRLNELGVSRLTRASRANIKGSCARFIALMGSVMVNIADFDLDTQERAGRDFWFTRQGHGVGYFDRDDETYGCEEIRDRLDQHAQHTGESYVEIANGWIHVR